MLSDEEKKAIVSLIEIREFANLSSYKDTKISQLNAIDVVLNLIEKQQKEIEELKEKNKKLQDRSKELIFEKQELTSALLDSTPNDKINAKIEEVDKDENASIPDIIESQIGRIITSQDYYRESLHSLDDYEYICNCCLEIFESNLKYKKVAILVKKKLEKKSIAI